MLVSNEPSIKYTFVQDFYPFSQVLRIVSQVFKEGHYHSGSLHQYIILPICCVYLFVINLSYIRKKNVVLIIKDKANWIMLWIMVNCLLHGFNNYEPLKDFIGMIVPKLRTFSLERALWLNPFLWSFLFCIVLCKLIQKGWKRVPYFIIFLQIGVLVVFPSKYNHLSMNICNRIYENTGIALPGVDKTALTYEEFYSEDLFENIKEEIDYSGEAAVAYGMHPAVLNYNMITTIDGYSSVYPQSYRLQFRELIEEALERNEDKRLYFDKTGIRAYIYGINYLPVADLGITEADIYIEPEKFTQMGGKYIFSRVRILNAEELGFCMLGAYQNDNSPYTIYVYEK